MASAVDVENTLLYAVGKNTAGEFAINHSKNLEKLTNLHIAIDDDNIIHIHKLIKNIHCGFGYNIYSDNKNKYWAAGQNVNGECAIKNNHHQLLNMTPIKYFEQNNIHIRKVCINVSGSSTFWITNDVS